MYKADGALAERAYNCCGPYPNNQRWSRLAIGYWAR